MQQTVLKGRDFDNPRLKSGVIEILSLRDKESA